MTAARDEVLARIRAALVDVGPTARGHGVEKCGLLAPAAVLELFVERVEETGASVLRPAVALAGIEDALRLHGADRVVIAPDLEAGLRPVETELTLDHDLAPAELDALDGAVTTCAAACADTGTIAFDGGPGQGRRAITLVPDLHICVVRAEQVVETVPELFARLEESAREGRPIVLVSGPSATSDIGFERVEGVHGPRRLVVVLVG